AFKSYNANEKSLNAYTEAFKYMEQKFDVGLINALDYNVAKTQLTKAKSDLLSAKYDYIFKTKILDFYMGKPITLEEYK
ncbi:MAG: TolC family protein, partial [Bacteroidales bacterium]|nr:TolC family protein [Bacteroidales bacterium]